MLVLLGVGAAFVGLIVILVLAVTFLGTSASSRFSRIEVAIPSDAPSNAPEGPGTPSGAITDANGVPVDAAWTRFTAADGSFSMDVPVEPEVVPLPNDEITIARAEVTSSTVGPVGYGVMVFEYKPEYPIANPPLALEFFVDNGLPALDMTVTSREPGTFASSPSLAFSGTVTSAGNDNELVEGVAFVAGSRLYVLLTTSDPGSTAETDRFLGSFVLG